MSSKNRLGLNLFEANLKRHPSVKGLFDEDGNNYHYSLKNDDDNSPSSEKLELNFVIGRICHNNEKDTRLLPRKTARNKSNDSEN